METEVLDGGHLLCGFASRPLDRSIAKVKLLCQSIFVLFRGGPEPPRQPCGTIRVGRV